MMNSKRSILALLLLAVMTVASAKDIRTVVFTTRPQMHCDNCEIRIKGNLRFEKGIKEIETNVDEQKVTVKYDADKTTVEKLLKAFEKFGYTAREVKADETVDTGMDESCPNM